MMKIIVSHDVDHLYATEHVFRDLYLEKLCVRSGIQLLKHEVSLKTFLWRLTMLLHNRMNRIQEVIDFDRSHSIPSTFFLGMSSGLGMSYPQTAVERIMKQNLPKWLIKPENMFDFGVHGIDFENDEKIKHEHDAFKRISKMESFGVRNHYVRFNDNTFHMMANAGYLFDSTYFNKKELELRVPFKVESMWEFPLHIMDTYVCKSSDLSTNVQKTIEIIESAKKTKMLYCTILFHDCNFDDCFDPKIKKWYMEVVHYCEEHRYPFVNYRMAIKELEASNE